MCHAQEKTTSFTLTPPPVAALLFTRERMASSAVYLASAGDGAATLPRDGFATLEGEPEAYAEARHAAYHACAAELQYQVDDVLDRLNQSEFERIAEFLSRSTRQLQQCWKADQDLQLTPPYSEVPAALVHTGCSMADLGLTLQQLLRSLRTTSPHVAVLRSKECGSVTAAVRSLVSQLVAPTARCTPGCTFDFAVLAGWHRDLEAGRVAASVRPSGERPGVEAPRTAEEKAAASGTGRSTVFPVVFEDVEHFDTQVLNDLIYVCTAARSADGRASLPLALVLVLPSGAAALQTLLARSTLVLLHANRFALATT